VIGTDLGSYRVLSKLGEGGMGQVYRASDTQLGRDVALKILPDAFAHDPDRLTRFEREARTLATLNHPNIASIYGIEKQGSVRALVMELVPGQTLDEVIFSEQSPVSGAGPASGSAARPAPAAGLPLNEALSIARQIAEALEAAHEAGIIHRDLKPANIKVRDDGTVKVLDFGLAKALGQGPEAAVHRTDVLSNSPTLLSPAMTQMGLILGTAAYMAPEQAKGQLVDRRADVWAFGVILYEMLTGRRLFDAADISDTLAAVLTRQPDWQELPAATPPAIRRLLSRCLARDRRARLDSMAAARLEIEDVLAGRGAAPSQGSSSPAARRAIGLPLVAGIAAVALVTGGLIGAWLRPASVADDAPMMTSVPAPQGVVSAFDRGFALSPDGQMLVTSARTGDGVRTLWRRRLSEPLFERIAGTEEAMYPFWSPGGGHVGFFAAGLLRRVPIAGGPVQTICEARGPWPRGSWNERDQILFSLGTGPTSGVFAVTAGGGTPTKVPLPDGATAPQWIPGGRHFLFHAREGIKSRLMAGSVERGEPTLVMELDFPNPGALLTPAGVLVFNRAGALYAQRFDAAALAVTGSPHGIGQSVGTPRGWYAASASAGSLLVLSNPTSTTGGNPGDPLARLRWVDRRGRTVGEIGEPGRYWTLRLSPDGLRAAVNPDGDVWTIDARTNIRTRLTSHPGEAVAGIWSPDGRRLIYRGPEGVWMRSSDGDGRDTQVLRLSSSVLVPSDWSPDATRLLATAREGGERPTMDISVISIADGEVSAWLATEFNESQARFSPSGRWVAYASNVTGRSEIYVRPFEGGSGAVRISSDGGDHPIWRRDGRELFYLSPSDEVVAVDVSALETTRVPGTRETLFRVVMNDVIRDHFAPYDVAPDGQRFLLNVADAPEPLLLIQRFERLLEEGR
jgi:tRNA A-37 threonylcarbamoyl transferase component Bud32